MARIALGGWQHETNTFAPDLADYAAFVEADEWPGLAIGEALFQAVRGFHLPITGALEVLDTSAHELVPLLWCSAAPSSYVTNHAFEKISEHLLAQLSAALPLDGIYLDLHGAMVSEDYADGEGEILRRIRQLVGVDVPIAISLDMHANITAQMVEQATVIDVFRTYPHIDMGDTGARTARHLLRLINGERWYKSMRKTDFLIPLNWGCTWQEPAATVYRHLDTVISGNVHAAAIAVGFHLSDIAEVGPAVLAYGETQADADTASAALLDLLQFHQADFSGEVILPEVAVATAMQLAQDTQQLVILADTQDNPGGGGTGDTTGILRELINQRANGAVVAVIADAEAAARAHEYGAGADISLKLGEKSGMRGHQPFTVNAAVLALGDGQFTATGPMYRGARMQLGPMALFDIEGIKVIVSSKKVQVADKSILRHLGIEPEKQNIIVLKSSVHFRNDFEDISTAIFLVKSPGAVIADPGELSYRKAIRR